MSEDNHHRYQSSPEVMKGFLTFPSFACHSGAHLAVCLEPIRFLEGRQNLAFEHPIARFK